MLGTKHGNQTLKLFYQGEVISNEDNFDSGILKIRIPEVDKNITDTDLPPCYPLFNFQFFRVMPQKGERVFVIFDRIYDTDNKLNQEKRYWNALIISNVSKINYDPFYYTSASAQSDGWNIPEQVFKNLPTANGLFPNLNDVIIRGRNNTDISLRNGEILLRSGRHLQGLPFVYNKENPAFIQIKYKKEDLTRTDGTEKTVIETIPPEYTIKITRIDLRVLIKVINKSTKNITESFSGTYNTKEELIFESKRKINQFQENYPLWEIRTTDDYFDDLPTIFQNNTRLVVKTVPEEQKAISIPPSINIVADHINLLSHKTNQYDLTNPDGQINGISQQNINKSSERMVKGDTLLMFLELVRDYINNHVHPYHGVKACNDDIVRKLNEFDLEELVNDYIRIN